MRKSILAALLVIEFFMIGCTAPKIRLFPSQEDPLQEFTLEGKAKQKVLVIPVRGIISNAPREGFIRSRPSMVQEVVSQLRLAKKDENVKAVLINIFGGILRCDILAEGVVQAAQTTGITVPVVIRMEGTNVDEGRKILAGSDLNLITATDLKDAAEKIAAIANQ